MIKEPNMLVDQTHSLGAVLKGAILLIFFVFGVEVYAQSYSSQVSYRVGSATQSTPSVSQSGGYGVSVSGNHMSSRIGTPISEYKMYQGTVYEPFGSAVPSDDNPVSNADGLQISGRKNLTGGGDPGNQSQNSPVGEPWVMLLFAAVAAVWVGVRSKEPRTKTNQ